MKSETGTGYTTTNVHSTTIIKGKIVTMTTFPCIFNWPIILE